MQYLFMVTGAGAIARVQHGCSQALDLKFTMFPQPGSVFAAGHHRREPAHPPVTLSITWGDLGTAPMAMCVVHFCSTLLTPLQGNLCEAGKPCRHTKAGFV